MPRRQIAQSNEQHPGNDDDQGPEPDNHVVNLT
jgi:hypothetical protein